ncbi:hypothetical protein ABPG75_001071 [Micractinium tetrahymenae]
MAIAAMNSPVLEKEFSRLPDAATAAAGMEGAAEPGGLPGYTFSSPAHETRAPLSDDEARLARYGVIDRDAEPPLKPETMSLCLKSFYGQPVETTRGLTFGRLLNLAALLESKSFTAKLDAMLQRKLLTSGGREIGLEEAAKLAVKHSLPKTAAVLIPLLASPDPEDNRGSKAGFEALDEFTKSLAFQFACLSPAERAEQGLADPFGAAFKMEKQLEEEGWADKAAEWRQAKERRERARTALAVAEAAAAAAEAGAAAKGGEASPAGAPAPEQAEREPLLSAAALSGAAGPKRDTTAGPKPGAPGAAAGPAQGQGPAGAGGAAADVERLAATPYKDLQAMAKKLGLKASGKAQELAERILVHQKQQE